MLGEIIQFNPSTSKLIFNSSTKKLMWVGDGALDYRCCRCPADGITPKYLTVAISGVQNCGDHAGQNGAAINGRYYLQIDTDTCDYWTDYGCAWLYEDVGNVRLYAAFIGVAVPEITVAGMVWCTDHSRYEGAYRAVASTIAEEYETCEDVMCTTEDNLYVESGPVNACSSLICGYGGSATWALGYHINFDGAEMWTSPRFYHHCETCTHGGKYYRCMTSHISSTLNEPGVGVYWRNFWHETTCPY